MANYVYVDNSNLWIEGQYVSAVKRGMAMNVRDAHYSRVCDSSFRVDFGKLFNAFCMPVVGRAILFGSRPPSNDSLWSAAESAKFKIIVHDRSASNEEKKIDTAIAAEMAEDIYTRINNEQDEIILIAGDKDHVPILEKAKGRGIKVRVVFWNQAAGELKQAATVFVPLDNMMSQIAF